MDRSEVEHDTVLIATREDRDVWEDGQRRRQKKEREEHAKAALPSASRLDPVEHPVEY